MQLLIQVSVVLLGYILGSIPFGLVFVKLIAGKDVRARGQRPHRRDKCSTSRRSGRGPAHGDRGRSESHGRRLAGAGGAADIPLGARAGSHCSHPGTQLLDVPH